jgi:hypothetical protein
MWRETSPCAEHPASTFLGYMDRHADADNGFAVLARLF